MTNTIFNTGQVLKLTHESGNEYFGEVIERDGKLYAKTYFFNWHIELDEKILIPRSSWFKSIEVVGMMPNDVSMLDLPEETLELFQNIRDGKFNDKKWVEEWKKSR